MSESGINVALVSQYEDYRFKQSVVGFVEPSSTFAKDKRALYFGDGSSMDVKLNDLAKISLTQTQIKKIFPHYD